jgi:FAD synthase
VSSSRIRDAILQAGFQEAREMLGHDYCLDLEGAEPALRGTAASVDRRLIRQVLPPMGSYRAELRGEAARLRTQVTLTADTLEWDSGAGWRVSEICFSD